MGPRPLAFPHSGATARPSTRGTRTAIGKLGAHDKTAGESVTNFTRSTKLYRTAIGYNAGLDRDHDGIACEQL